MHYHMLILHVLLFIVLLHSPRANGKVNKAGKHGKNEAKSEIEADWKGLTDPNDIFASFKPSFMRKVMDLYTPAQLITFVQQVKRKLERGQKLSNIEKLTWRSTSSALLRNLQTTKCRLFFSKMWREWGTCCRICAAGEKYAFCVTVRLLGMSRGRLIKLLAKKTKPPRKVVRKTTRWQKMSLSPAKLRLKHLKLASLPDPTDRKLHRVPTVFVDLFSVPCHPPVDFSLCSQNCCTRGNHYALFCNSRLECY